MSEIKEAFDNWVETFDTEGDEWQDMMVDRVYEQGWKDSRQDMTIEQKPVAIVDRVGIMQRLSPYTNLPEGAKLYTQATTVVPEGWKLVPVEPTSDMLGEIHLDASFSHRAMTVRYRAMLDAAPEAPEAPGQEQTNNMLDAIDDIINGLDQNTIYTTSKVSNAVKRTFDRIRAEVQLLRDNQFQNGDRDE